MIMTQPSTHPKPTISITGLIRGVRSIVQRIKVTTCRHPTLVPTTDDPINGTYQAYCTRCKRTMIIEQDPLVVTYTIQLNNQTNESHE